jgi:hypothetical protein
VSETTTKTQAETPEESGPLLTSYRVSWMQKGTDKSRTDTCIVDSDDLTRPGDPEQLRAHLRKMLAIRHLPIGQAVPDNIVLEVVDPICNCEPFPGDNCAFAEHGGERFFLATAKEHGFEWVTDRHDNRALGLVLNTLSVDFLTMVRARYGHK